MKFVMGDGLARYLYIPRGVAYGDANMSSTCGQIFYVLDRQFSPDPKDSDEKRLPWNVAGENFWSMERG